MSGLENLTVLMPEIIVVVGAMILLLGGVFSFDERNRGDVGDDSVITWLAIGILGLACGFVVYGSSGDVLLFNGSLIVDNFARFMKVLVLVGAMMGLLLSVDYLREKSISKFEFPVLVLLASAGMLLMTSANDLITLYLSLELQSLALYVLAAFHRDNLRSSEAGLKYFVLGALSSGMLLYGASLVYGFAGTTSFTKIMTVPALVGGELNVGLVFGLVFILVGLAFKISAVPFHMWTPDVYEGAPTPVTAFFAAAPKIAAMALFMRVLNGAFPDLNEQWQQIIIFVSIASMGLGAFAAIGQDNIKRLMAYSSIGHIGFALVGVATNTQQGAQATLVYLAIYLVMTLGTFACILAMRRNEHMVEDIDELSGLAQNNLGMACALAVLMFSLAGLPPFAGFIGKLYVFNAAIEKGMYPLAVIGVLASVVGAYYYLRVVKVMFFDAPKEKFSRIHRKLKLVMGLAVALVIVIMILPAPLIGAAAHAAKSLQFL